jgi:hypothetical protein
MLVQDNQQVTENWFVGILEGEGCDKGNEITITNTNRNIINECENFLRRNFILFHTIESKHKQYKRWWTIHISKDEFNKLYTIINPHLQCQFFGTSETTREFSVDLNWLAGIYEAEGDFSLELDNQDRAQFDIDLTNSNDKIIQKIILAFRNKRVPYYITNYIKKKNNYKLHTRIRIRGLLRCQKFIELMRNKWVSPENIKKTELMKEFIDSRLKMELREPLTQRQLQIIQTMRDLNRKKI